MGKKIQEGGDDIMTATAGGVLVVVELWVVVSCCETKLGCGMV